MKRKYTDRDARGRFLEGNNISAQRHRISGEQFYTKITADNFDKVVEKLLALALKGNTKCIFYILDRCLGKMPDKIEIEKPYENQEEKRLKLMEVIKNMAE